MDFKAKAREIVQRELKAYHVSPRQGVERFDIYQAIEDALVEAFDAGAHVAANLADVPMGDAERADRLEAMLNRLVEARVDQGLVMMPGTGPTVLAAPEGHILDDKGAVRQVLGVLPVTVDGAVVMPGKTVWQSPKHPFALQSDYTIPVAVHEANGVYRDLRVGECYSTREAAEEGRKA